MSDLVLACSRLAKIYQQGTLAGTGCAYDRDAFAALYVEVDALEHRHILFADREGLAQIAAGNNRLSPQFSILDPRSLILFVIHSVAPPPVASWTRGNLGKWWPAG